MWSGRGAMESGLTAEGGLRETELSEAGCLRIERRMGTGGGGWAVRETGCEEVEVEDEAEEGVMGES